MITVNRVTFFPILLVLLAVVSFSANAENVAKEQKEIRQKTSETLRWLYEMEPSARQAVENNYGYAVFSNFGMKILVAGGGKGKGEAINNRTGKETFMKMLEVQAGLGMGIKKFRVVFVFENEEVFNKFVNSGWEFGGQTTAAAKLDDEGGAFAGAATVSPGVWVYQLTEDGLALEVTVKGTKYMKDDDLN